MESQTDKNSSADSPPPKEATKSTPPATTLPVDIWFIIFQYLTTPLTQFIGSPTAAANLDQNEQIHACQDLLRAAHVNKAAYSSARPFLYGNLYVLLRTDATTFAHPKVEPLQVEESTNDSVLTETTRLNYYARRAWHHGGRSMFAPFCCAECARKHSAGELIEMVSEVPEVFPFVVRGGKLYLPSLLEREPEAARTPEAIGRSVASLLGGSEDGGAPHVEIIDGLVLIPYPLHLVSGLHIHSGDVSLSSWLATTKDTDHNDDGLPLIFAESTAAIENDHHDWAVKLPFIRSLPKQKLTSLTLIDHDEDNETAFTTLLTDLFQAYPHIRTLDVVTNLGYRYNFPAEFPNRVQHVSLFSKARGWDLDYNRLPAALSRTDLRHLEIYGQHSFILKHWQHVFNLPTLSSLVTDFSYNSADQDPQPLLNLSAPGLKSWTTNNDIALTVFLDDLLPPIDQPIFTALQELTLVHKNWGYWCTVSLPKGYAQVPAIPFGRLPTLRKFSVLPKHSEQHVWINIKAPVLRDLLSLPHLDHLSLPNVLPYSISLLTSSPIRSQSLQTLDINVNLFVDMLAAVEVPNITSLTLHTGYFPDPEHQLSRELWQQIHNRWGSQLVHFGYRRLSYRLDASPICGFPSDLVFPALSSIDMFTCVGTLDLAHIAMVAPNLESAKIDADHVSNLRALLTHPTLTHLQLAGPRCPTMLESLLDHPTRPNLHLSLIPRAVEGLYGEYSTAIGRVCTRTSVTLTYDRDRNRRMWKMLARSEHLGKLRHWMRESGGTEDDQGQEEEENEWQATVVVPTDLGSRDARSVGRFVGEVLGEWNGVKVQVGVREGRGRRRPRAVERLVEGVTEEMASASVKWIGKVQVGQEGEAVGVCGDE